MAVKSQAHMIKELPEYKGLLDRFDFEKQIVDKLFERNQHWISYKSYKRKRIIEEVVSSLIDMKLIEYK